MKFIDDVSLENKKILLRADFNVSLNPQHKIANDERIKQTIPTIELLLKHNNRLIIASHLGRPEGRDQKFSLRPILKDLQSYLPHNKVILVDDFTKDTDVFEKQTPSEILLLENIRFYPGEETNNLEFAKQLASLADVYVNDAFSVSHRDAASIVGVTHYLPSYGGLLLKKEVKALSAITQDPKHPFVAILGGSKISTKIKLIQRLTQLADTVILGGGLANTFLQAQGLNIGKSISEKDQIEFTHHLLDLAKRHHTNLLLPKDVLVGNSLDQRTLSEKLVHEVEDEDIILDIGPETQALYEKTILEAKTIAWNGPVGYFENPDSKRGTDFMYYAITQNDQAFSVVGGGETLAALDKKEYLDKISHISTAGGAMLEFIENGTLPGLKALEK